MKISLLGTVSIIYATLMGMVRADELPVAQEPTRPSTTTTSNSLKAGPSTTQPVGKDGGIDRSAPEPFFQADQFLLTRDSTVASRKAPVTMALETSFPVGNESNFRSEEEATQQDSPGDPVAKKQLSQLLDVQAMIGPMNDAATTLSRLGLNDSRKDQSSVVPGDLRSPTRAYNWGPTAYTWSTPVFYHRPLYFEQPNLERYGNGPWRIAQPVTSAAHFLLSVPLVPVKMLHNPPCAEVYTLGEGRPGNLVRMQSRYDVLFKE